MYRHGMRRHDMRRAAGLPSWLARAALLAATVLAAAGARAQAAEIVTEFDSKTDFSKYKTYTWRQKPDSGSADRDALIVAEIEGQLKAKGWTAPEEGQAGDTVLAVHAIVREDQTIDTAYSGWGPGWSWGGPGPGAGSATTILTKERLGTLVVDIFDASTRKVIWRGSAKGTLTTDAETNKRKLNQAVTRLFKKFPPGSAP